MHADELHPTSPYAPPRTETAAASPEVGDTRSTQASWALRMALAPLLSAAVLMAVAIAGLTKLVVVLGVLQALSVLVAGAGTILGVVAAVRLLSTPRAGRPKGLLQAGLAAVLGPVMASFGAMVAMAALGGFSRGRQVRRAGKRVFAPLGAGQRWSAPVAPSGEVRRSTEEPGLGAGEADEVARGWRTNGLTEHASVAAFGALSLELAELGAPPELIVAAHQDALDEINHTRLCFALARRIDGRALEPLHFPAGKAARTWPAPRALRLARLAVESLVDGAVNEGMSARALAALLRAQAGGTARPQLEAEAVEVVRQIVRDEARHAAHGFDVLRWCLAEGGAPVRAAVAGAARALPQDAPAEADDGSADGRYERLGLPSRARKEGAYRAVRERVLARTARLLAS